VSSDADNVYIVLTATGIRPDLYIVARAGEEGSEQKLLRAGADRVVNPQRIGGNRIAAFALQPHVTDFLDVAMHDEDVEFRLEQVLVHEGSPLAGSTVREARLHEGDGALLLALRRREGGQFRTNPAPDAQVRPGDVVIVIGTGAQIDDVRRAAGSPHVGAP
jgi:voltage-gated potassium channel